MQSQGVYGDEACQILQGGCGWFGSAVATYMGCKGGGNYNPSVFGQQSTGNLDKTVILAGVLRIHIETSHHPLEVG